MSPRSSTPPSGPRGSSPARRGIARGGIHKRRGGTPKVDNDGDLLMDTIEGKPTLGRDGIRPDGTKGYRYRAGGRGGQFAGMPSNNLLTQRSQQAVIRGLESQQANMVTPRITENASADHAGSERKLWRHDPQSPIVSLRVRGLKESKAASNSDGGLKDLLSFLERKATGQDVESHRIVRIKKSYMNGDSVIIKASPDDLARILKLNNFKFAGSTLSIEAYHLSLSGSSSKDEEDMSHEARKTQEQIKSILSARYDSNLKLLNLSRLGQDPGLVQMGMFDERNRISKIFPVLMVVCDRLFSSAQEKQEAILSVTLAENELDNILNVITLAQTFPDLQNLDISRNRISNLQALAGWKGKFCKLQNLKLSQNPLEVTSPDYVKEIATWFPNLQVLNETHIRTLEEVVAVTSVVDKPIDYSRKSSQASPIPMSGPDFRDVNQIGEGFLRQFFSLYDNDRVTLANNFYDANSTHSLSINVSAPRSEEGASSHPFPSAAFNKSRNLVKVKALQGQMSKIFRGTQAIKLFWAELPRTIHPDLSTHTVKYLIDCHPLAGLIDQTGQSLRGVDGLVLMVHGEYEEIESIKTQQIKRSFSRIFVLGPGLPVGPVIRVVSDVLLLRAWSPLVSISTEKGVQMQLQMLQLGPIQEAILKQLVFQTQMTPEYARLCLEETGWNLEKAAVAFDVNKSKLPAHAFISRV